MGLLDFFKRKKDEEATAPNEPYANKVRTSYAEPSTGKGEEPAAGTAKNTFRDAPDDVAATEQPSTALPLEETTEREPSVFDTAPAAADPVAELAEPEPDNAPEHEPVQQQLPLDFKEENQPLEEQTPQLDAEPPAEQQAEEPSYLGNLEHTALIDQLLRVPRDERDDQWIGSFLSHVATASFVCGEPQVIQGPDNFPYFQIFIPEANKPFQCYVLEHMVDDFLLENGLGIALEPKDGQVEWVLSYGDLLHYSVHRTFAIPQDHPFGKSKEGDEVIQEDEQVLVGAPSTFVLPEKARGVIRSFLQAQGIADPKICLIDRSHSEKGQDLVFNLVPAQFESQAHYRAIMQALGWFLPRYYTYIGAEESAFQGHFLSL